jgi:hypothetical protein
MMKEPLKISLGGQDYRIRPLNLRQLRDLGIGAAVAGEKQLSADPAEREAALWDRWIDIILLGINPEHADITRENLLAMHTTSRELVTAVNQILEFAGVEMEEKKPGEPAAAAGSTGVTSTGA